MSSHNGGFDGKRHPQVRADMLLHNLEAIAADMARNNVQFSPTTSTATTVGFGREGLPLSSPSSDGVVMTLGGGGGPSTTTDRSTKSERPSTGQLKEHVHDIQHRIQLAVTNHFVHGVDMGVTTVAIDSTPRGSPRHPVDISNPSTPATMYSTLVQTAKRAKKIDTTTTNDGNLYRLPGIAPAGGAGPMVINHFNSSAPSATPFHATSLGTTSGQQPVSARFHRALLDGNTSSMSLRELTLVAERQQSPRSYSHSNRGVVGGMPRTSPRRILATPTTPHHHHTGGKDATITSLIPLSHQPHPYYHTTTTSTTTPTPSSVIPPPPLSPRAHKKVGGTSSSTRKQNTMGTPTSSLRRSRPSDAALHASLDALQSNLHVGSMPALDVRSVKAALGTTHKTPRPPLPHPPPPASITTNPTLM